MENLKTLTKFNLTQSPTGFAVPTEKVVNSASLYKLLQAIHAVEGNDFQEFFYVLLFNRANILTGYYLASMGGMTATIADPRLIIKVAALANCTSIVVCHNHPSGNLVPSMADESVTQRIKNGASYFDIKLLDHLIITEDQGYYSFADEGIL